MRQEALKEKIAAQAGLAALAWAADTAAQPGPLSPKLKVRIHAERAGTRGFWETIEVNSARFRRGAAFNIVFEAQVTHELFESIDSSMPRQSGVRADFAIVAILKPDGTVVSAQMGERRNERQMWPTTMPWHRASPAVDWRKVAVAAAERVMI